MPGLEIAAGFAALTAAFFWPGTRTALRAKRFFTEPETPWNLALFRIVFFGWLWGAGFETHRWMFGLPAELRAAPAGYGFLMPWIPFDESFYGAARIVMQTSAFAAMLGFRARFFAAAVALSGLYVLGLPNFFGKINHGSHHFIWFAVIFACSRASDVLSVDAVLKAWQRGHFDEPPASRAYALPLRFMALLIAQIYFFPGLWKLLETGSVWIFSDNLSLILQSHWLRKSFVPGFRMDEYPLLCQAAAFSAAAFEAGFVFLLFHPVSRGFAALGGIIFHRLTEYLMRINFISLQVCLFVLVDWAALLRRAGRFVKKQKGRGFRLRTAPRAAAVLRTLDAAGLLEDETPSGGSGAAEVRGFPALAVWAGVFFLVLQVICGVTRFDSWPVGIYPAFAYRASPYLDVLTAQAVSGKQVFSIDLNRAMKSFTDPRWNRLSAQILAAKDESERRDLLLALTGYLIRRMPELRGVEEIRYARARMAVKPERWKNNPVAAAGLAAIRISQVPEGA